MEDKRKEYVERQFADVAAKYVDLSLAHETDRSVVSGTLRFVGEHEAGTIEDSFTVKIALPGGYPNLLPVTWETGGRIPKDFHKLGNGSLCLGAPFEVYRKFRLNPTLVGYIESLVIPYLYSFSYWEQHGVMPYGERSHGREGVLEYYREFFGVSSDIGAVRLLRLLAKGRCKGHQICPCGSGKRLRDCHGPLLWQNCKTCDQRLYRMEYAYLRDHMAGARGR